MCTDTGNSTTRMGGSWKAVRQTVQGMRLMATDRRLRPLDGVRALAVVGVLAAHAGIPFLPGGFVGVDVFFVLSGFLITSLLYAELAATGRIDLGGVSARPARGLLPPGRGMVAPGPAARPLFV